MLAEDYVVYLWNKEYTYSKIAKVHAALQFYCEINNIKLRISDRTNRIVAGYRKLDKVRRKNLQRQPINKTLLTQLVNISPTLEFQAALITTFCGLIRVGELLNLRWKDIKFTEKLIFISKSKSDKNKTGADIRMFPPIQSILSQLATRRPHNADPNDLIFGNFTRAALNSTLKKLCTQLQVGNKYSWHCLRHGGATTLHALGASIQEIMIHGRWKDIRSCYRYIHQAEEDEDWE